MRDYFIKYSMRILSVTLLTSTLMITPVYAGQWKDSSSENQNDDRMNTDEWTWNDGISVYSDAESNKLSVTTTDKNTENTDELWKASDSTQSQEDHEKTAYVETYPLKGRVEQYFTMDPDEGLIWAWDRIYLKIHKKDVMGSLTASQYVMQNAIKDRNTAYLYNFGGGVVAALAKLSGVPISSEFETNPKTQALANEINAFLNSFDWRNATDLEKAVNICNWIQKADYDYDNVSNVDAEAHSLYGCLVEKKALCDGYTEAAGLLGVCVDLPVYRIGSINHTYPVFYVDGVWLANEPTSKDKYFTIADAYTKTISGDNQPLGQYCEGTGYTIPTDISHIPGVGMAWIYGEESQVINFK